MRRFNKRMRELDAEGAQRRGGFLTRVVRSSRRSMGHANGQQSLTCTLETRRDASLRRGDDAGAGFLISCGEGVNRLGTEEPSDRITDLTACYMALVEHGEGCDNCNEV